MRGSRGQLASRFGALGVLVLALLFASPTTALAQIDIEDTVESAGSGVDETVDKATDKVDETVDAVEDRVDGTAGSEGGAVDQTTDTIDRTTGNTGQAVDDTVDDATDVAGEVSQGRVPSLHETVSDTAGRVGGLVDSILGANGGSRNRDADDRPGSGGSPADRIRADGIDGFAAAMGTISSGVTTSLRSDEEVALGSAPASLRSPQDSLIESIGDVLPQVAFPALLLVLVAVYLVIQGRVDRSDPKLALAPIDIDQEYLSFR